MMKRLPVGWKIEKFGSLGRWQSGGTPSRKIPEFFGGTIPWITTVSLKGETIDEKNAVEFITEEAINKSATKLIPSGSLLIGARVGVGKTAINKIPLATNQDIIAISGIDTERYSISYLMKCIKGFIPYLVSQQRGATIQGITSSILKELDIPSPPLPQQEKIVSVLDTASQLVEKQKALIEKYDLFLKSKFIEMFGDPVLNPMGWEVTTIGDITKVQTGKTPSRKKSEYWEDGTENWAKTTEVNALTIFDTEEKITVQAVQENNLIVFPIDTILIAMYGQGKTRGKVVRLGAPSTINQAFGAILPSKNYNTVFLISQLSSLYKEIRDLGRGGNQENLNLDIVRKIKVTSPPIELQDTYAKVAKQVAVLKQKEQKKLEKLQTLYDALMQRAFNGEIV